MYQFCERNRHRLILSRIGRFTPGTGQYWGQNAIQAEFSSIRCNSKAVRTNALIPTGTNGSL
jgi:hypothetical protein